MQEWDNTMSDKLRMAILVSVLLVAFISMAISEDVDTAERNDIISFLEGEWWNVDITVAGDGGVTLNEYRELMTVKDRQTITVTAFDIREGTDVTKDITIEVRGDSVVLKQDGFEARGTKIGNRVVLEGKYEAMRMEFRLYLMNDTYIYQKDIWENGVIVQSQMSYLRRINPRGN